MKLDILGTIETILRFGLARLLTGFHVAMMFIIGSLGGPERACIYGVSIVLMAGLKAVRKELEKKLKSEKRRK